MWGLGLREQRDLCLAGQQQKENLLTSPLLFLFDLLPVLQVWESVCDYLKGEI